MILFFLIISYELALTAYLSISHRMVIGNDTFCWFTNQWYFVNSMLSHHEIPLWTPFITHGQLTSYLYTQLGVFSKILILFPDLIKQINFLPLFYLGLFVDKFILLTGVWLLAKRYFKSQATVFFVTSTVLATTITLSQVVLNISLICCLPLILYLLHRFFDSWDWKWPFLALFIFSTVGICIGYSVFIIPLVVFLYFLVVFYVSPLKNIADFKIRTADFIWFAGIAVVLFFLGRLFLLERDPLFSVHVGERLADGTVSLHTFLTYGGGTKLFKWWELGLGVSSGIDNTIYLGVLAIPLIVLGIVDKDKNKYPFMIGAIFFLLFSMATPLTMLVYYCWPMIKFYRHIGLIAPLIKLYLCFLAGFGFQKLIELSQDQQEKELRKKVLWASGLLLFNGIFLILLFFNIHLRTYFLSHCAKAVGSAMVLPTQVKYWLLFTAFLSIVGSLIFLTRIYVKTLKHLTVYVFVLLSFHLLVVYSYAFEQVLQRTAPLTPKQYALMEFQKIPYHDHRSPSEDVSARADFLKSFIGERSNYETDYDFTFSDMARTTRHSDMSLKPYDQLTHIFNDRTVLRSRFTGLGAQGAVIVKGLIDQGILENVSPTKLHLRDNKELNREVIQKIAKDDFEKVWAILKDTHDGKMTPVFLKLVGASEGKVQFFAKAYPSKSAAIAIQDKNFSGDLLFYDPLGRPGLQPSEIKKIDLSQNQRLRISYQVLSFSPNEITIRVDPMQQDGVWLLYADTWHLGWKASINGRPQQIYPGNLAYKAIPLVKGENIIRFYFESNDLKNIYLYFSITSLILIVLLIVLLI